MNYPAFESDLLITTEEPILKFYFDKVLIEGSGSGSIKIEVQKLDRNKIHRYGSWLNVNASLIIYLNDSFIKKYLRSKTRCLKIVKLLIKPFDKFSIKNSFAEKYNRKPPFPILSLFYKKNKDIFHFIFDLDVNENDYLLAFNEAMNTIKSYTSEKNGDFKILIQDIHIQSDGLIYLVFEGNTWKIQNPILDVVQKISEGYRHDKDIRIKKPYILLNEDNYRKYFVFDSNWVLHFDKLETLMIRPNDVSLYSSISDRNLLLAQEFYKNSILPRLKEYSGAFPSLKKQKEYYNYFELIITALIFAYTALEAFANICIHDDYEYIVEEKGEPKIYSKKEIEGRFPLKAKFNKILKPILNTPEPSKEKWWGVFIDLENIRDEIIHTKQSKSEDRYSHLLSKKIFKTILIHKEIIKFYGYYINQSKRSLLEHYPYNFGFDDVLPHLTSEEGYRESYDTLHNPHRNKS